MRIVILGPPGAGKGTQAGRLASALNLFHVATGDMLRAEAASGSAVGKLAHEYMVRGELVPDDVMVRMIVERLAGPESKNGVILDGFPRTLAQAEALDEALESAGKPIDRFLCLQVSREDLERRLLRRFVCGECQRPHQAEGGSLPGVHGRCEACGGELIRRADDNPESVHRRLAVYREQTAPVIEHYRRAGACREVDGEGTPDEVHERLVAAVR